MILRKILCDGCNKESKNGLHFHTVMTETATGFMAGPFLEVLKHVSESSHPKPMTVAQLPKEMDFCSAECAIAAINHVIRLAWTEAHTPASL